ncbi:MAG: addiction module protein [Methylobacter sp.]|nr:addiction module protein [Methylobacter sp.]
MSTHFEILQAEVLKLVPADRALLAEHIIASLDEDNEIESAWAVEVERCVAEIENGTVVGLPFEEVIAQARATPHEDYHSAYYANTPYILLIRVPNN